MTGWQFAREWCAAWNAHDLDRVLALFHDDVVFSSPLAAAMLPDTAGRIDGKAALRNYWAEGLRRIPDLHFTIDAVFEGVGTLVIQYRNQKGALVSEVLVREQGRVRWGAGCYISDHGGPQIKAPGDGAA
ncbi:nuclear transport factor 2 family protein [Sphingopyxis kveilinensis]|uniref:nuclear transport factor 2 family protein n=1 Tax=Sphingopyxis kveilinensis TaxID=3114367 RepID=UPI0030D5F4AE